MYIIIFKGYPWGLFMTSLVSLCFTMSGIRLHSPLNFSPLKNLAFCNVITKGIHEGAAEIHGADGRSCSQDNHNADTRTTDTQQMRKKVLVQ